MIYVKEKQNITTEKYEILKKKKNIKYVKVKLSKLLKTKLSLRKDEILIKTMVWGEREILIKGWKPLA